MSVEHSAFYEGFFRQLGEQVNSQIYVTLSPDHQNTLIFAQDKNGSNDGLD